MYFEKPCHLAFLKLIKVLFSLARVLMLVEQFIRMEPMVVVVDQVK